MTGSSSWLAAILYGSVLRRAFARAMSLWTARALRTFEADARRCVAINEETLTSILRRHRHTEFGRAHDFEAILATSAPLAEFRRRVPLSQYSDYEQALERMAAGAQNLLVSDPVVFFAPSSGTTGKSKMIPVTAHSMRRMLQILLLSRGVLAHLCPGSARGARGISLVRMADNHSQTAAGIPTGDASAAGMRRAALVIPYLYTTPPAALMMADKPSALFVHLLFGLLERDLNHISATFAHYVLHLFRTLEARWPDLLASIATGRLPDDLVMTPDERRAIEAQLRPMPELAAALRPELEKGMRDIARRLWPEFAFVAAAATGSFAAYVPPLREYIGSAPLYNLLYGATEASIGISMSPDHPDQYALIPGSCVFEFIPLALADNPAPRTVDLAELEQGGLYEVVITNDAGFYRYRMDDVIRVAGFHEGNPQVEFQFRRGTILNIAAEKTTEQQVADVVGALGTQWQPRRTRILDYTVMADTEASPPRYRFFLEVETGAGTPGATLNREAVAALDAGLAAANVDFQLMREARAIGEPVVDFVAPGSFQELLARMRNSNTVKVPRAIRDEEHIRFLVERSGAPAA